MNKNKIISILKTEIRRYKLNCNVNQYLDLLKQINVRQHLRINNEKLLIKNISL